MAFGFTRCILCCGCGQSNCARRRHFQLFAEAVSGAGLEQNHSRAVHGHGTEPFAAAVNGSARCGGVTFAVFLTLMATPYACPPFLCWPFCHPSSPPFQAPSHWTTVCPVSFAPCLRWVRGETSAPAGSPHLPCCLPLYSVAGPWEPHDCGSWRPID